MPLFPDKDKPYLALRYSLNYIPYSVTLIMQMAADQGAFYRECSKKDARPTGVFHKYAGRASQNLNIQSTNSSILLFSPTLQSH